MRFARKAVALVVVGAVALSAPWPAQDPTGPYVTRPVDLSRPLTRAASDPEPTGAPAPPGTERATEEVEGGDSEAGATPTAGASPHPRASLRPTARGPRPTARARGTARRAVAPVHPQRAIGRRVVGAVSWYCKPGRSACTRGYSAAGAYAAAGPRIRQLLGPAWRGRRVVVTSGGRSVVVTLVDWCACGGRLLDLYAGAFDDLAPLGSGLIRVAVREGRR